MKRREMIPLILATVMARQVNAQTNMTAGCASLYPSLSCQSGEEVSNYEEVVESVESVEPEP